MEKSHKFLYKTPQGAEGLLSEDAFRRQALTARIQHLFHLWGYQPVHTPVFDFYDLYAPYIRDPDKVYRLVDREGDLLLLRNDITLFLARALGMSLSENHTPLRVFYHDSILRHQDLEDISANEFYQIGAEFVGSQSPEGDWEILLLLHEILELLGLEKARIHVGSRALFDALSAGCQEKTLLQSRILSRAPRNAGAESPAPRLEDFFSFIGSQQEAQVWAEKFGDLLQGPALVAWNALMASLETLESLGAGDRFRLDLSEIGRQEYYTGLVFQAYHPGVGDAIASGGRYDTLLSRFGLNSPSVGFSLMLKKVEALVENPELLVPRETARAEGAGFRDRVMHARKTRTAGTPCKLG